MISLNALTEVKEKIERARARSGRENEIPVEIVAVTKTFPLEVIISAYEAGLKTIGETRVQEAALKFNKLPELDGLKKRMIGHLQTNKVKKAVKIFDAIDSVDSVRLGQKISLEAQKRGKAIQILLQVNTSKDPNKFGFDPEQEQELLKLINDKWLLVEGLMTIGPYTTDEARIRRSFTELRELKEKLNKQLTNEKKLIHLSMGMSNDFEIAVEEGATMIRLGTILFGPRMK